MTVLVVGAMLNAALLANPPFIDIQEGSGPAAGIRQGGRAAR